MPMFERGDVVVNKNGFNRKLFGETAVVEKCTEGGTVYVIFDSPGANQIATLLYLHEPPFTSNYIHFSLITGEEGD